MFELAIVEKLKMGHRKNVGFQYIIKFFVIKQSFNRFEMRLARKIAKFPVRKVPSKFEKSSLCI